MAPTYRMPAFGCEHLTSDNLDKVDSARSSSPNLLDPDFIQYTCLSCPTTGSFPVLDKHFDQSKHDLAITAKSIYCGQCKDLVYDPSYNKDGTRKRKIAPLSEEDEAYISQNTTQAPCGRQGVRGMFNLGETCYMNAVLQMMVHNPLLVSYFLGMGHPQHLCPISKEPEKKNDSDDSDDEGGEDKEQKTCVACAMTDLFSDASMVDQSTPTHAVNLLFASWKHIPGMSGKSQQDAHEWFTIIVDKLHEATINPAQISSKPQPQRCRCFFHKVFYGRFHSEVTCNTCHNVTSTEDIYNSIALEFGKQAKRKKKELKEQAKAADGGNDGGKKSSSNPPRNAVPNIFDCLKAYTAPEHLSEDSYTCKACSAPRSATKRLRIRNLPAILCIHVKRFGMKEIGGIPTVAEKYEGKLDFPVALDMGPYTTKNPSPPIPTPTPASSSKHKPNGTTTNGNHSEPHPPSRETEYAYDLECVVVHHGDHAHTGHYFAYCRQGGRWYRFDDEIVAATTLEDVLRQEAYLLFYNLRAIG